jgi:formate-dependent nitrite reductase membrane component NrfD
MQTQSLERAPYGRNGDVVISSGNGKQPLAPYHGETYYDQPVLNPSHYGQLVATYLFIGGIAGASQVIASIADLCGGRKNRPIVRAGRYLALGGAVAGPAFLVADLHTPERWYNMLRIFRRTSPMSIGSWTLAGFGTLSALTAGLQFIADRFRLPFYRRAARAASLPAAAAGAVVATYTGTLLGATSSPLWASVSRWLPALFGISAAATSTAALSIAAEAQGAPPATSRSLAKLALLSAGAELIVSSAMDREWKEKEVAGALEEEPMAMFYRAGYKGLAIAAPLVIYGLGVLTRENSRRRSIAASVATLAGGYLLRSVLLAAGRESAKRPRDYFRFTQPS